jgi:hypothetical protein
MINKKMDNSEHNIYFKEDKFISLCNLLDTLIGIFNDKRYIYPLSMRLFGFNVSQFDSEADLYGRIKLLSDLLFIPITIEFVEETLENNTKKIQCYIEKGIKEETKK